MFSRFVIIFMFCGKLLVGVITNDWTDKFTYISTYVCMSIYSYNAFISDCLIHVIPGTHTHTHTHLSVCRIYLPSLLWVGRAAAIVLRGRSCGCLNYASAQLAPINIHEILQNSYVCLCVRVSVHVDRISCAKSFNDRKWSCCIRRMQFIFVKSNSGCQQRKHILIYSYM